MPLRECRTVDAHEHADDLLEHPERRKVEWIVERRATAGRMKDFRRLPRERRKRRRIPCARFVVARLAEGVFARSALLLDAARKVVKVGAKRDVAPKHPHGMIVERGARRNVLERAVRYDAADVTGTVTV